MLTRGRFSHNIIEMLDTKASKYSHLIKQEAKRLGFFQTGISKAEFLEEEAPRLESWLERQMNGEMAYMERYFDKRLDPRILVPDAKSVISFLLNYFPEQSQKDPNAPKISKYAYGRDYHFVIKEKLKLLFEYIKEEIGDVSGRVFVDSAPVLDKAWAQRSGLGWIGKNTNLIQKNTGSFFFVAELIVDLELEYDAPVLDHCGTCTKCIDACPTDAIAAPYIVDGSKCISYYTIELKESIPDDAKGKFEGWAFGCDICQDVCPWNRFSTPTKDPDLKANHELLGMTQKDWIEITEETFNKVFESSPLKRTKHQGMKRNIAFLQKS